jgi:thioredoxin 1
MMMDRQDRPPATGMTRAYAATEPRREDVDVLSGATLLEFGSPWCGHCRIAQPLLETALAAHPEVRHLKIEDASGRRLGRSFQVKLWPTLVFLRDGKELARIVRPREAAPIERALGLIGAP